MPCVYMTFFVSRGRMHVTIDGETFIVPAQSGRPGPTLNNPDSQDQRDRGPIPIGYSSAAARELGDPPAYRDLVRNLLPLREFGGGDWGDWRVPLRPLPGTNTYGRSGFFIHGGSRPGSAGCIDIGGGIMGSMQTDVVRLGIVRGRLVVVAVQP